MSRITETEIVADVRRVARLLRHSPSSVEYMRLGRYHVRTLQRKFNTSWARIVEAAGLRYTPRTRHRIPSTEEISGDLRRVARLLAHPPTCSEYIKHGNFGSGTVRRRSGRRRWEDAVASLTGIDREEIKRHQQRGGLRYLTTVERLARLREISEELGYAPTTAEAGVCGVNPYELRRRLGTSWEGVLKAAGVVLSKGSRLSFIRSTPTEEMIEDMIRVSRQLGRVAKMREYEQRGRYSRTALSKRLGGWRHVKELARARLMEDKGRGRVSGPPGKFQADPAASPHQAAGVLFNQDHG